jgi:hypothetical protein
MFKRWVESLPIYIQYAADRNEQAMLELLTCWKAASTAKEATALLNAKLSETVTPGGLRDYATITVPESPERKWRLPTPRALTAVLAFVAKYRSH